MLVHVLVLSSHLLHDQQALNRTRCNIKPMDNQKTTAERHADRSAWVIWAVLVVIAVAILPFAVRNREIVRQLAALCGFPLD